MCKTKVFRLDSACFTSFVSQQGRFQRTSEQNPTVWSSSDDKMLLDSPLDKALENKTSPSQVSCQAFK